MSEEMPELPEGTTAEDAERYRRARLMLRIEDEKTNSPTVRLILEQAKVNAERAVQALIEADPHDANAVQRLQNEVRRFQAINVWIDTAIEEGAEALRQLEDEQAE